MPKDPEHSKEHDVSAYVLVEIVKHAGGAAVPKAFTTSGNTDGDRNQLARQFRRQLVETATGWAYNPNNDDREPQHGGTVRCTFSVSVGGKERTFRGSALASELVYTAARGVIRALGADVDAYLLEERGVEVIPKAVAAPMFNLAPRTPRRRWFRIF